MRKVLMDDVAAGGAEDVADKKDIHCQILHGCCGTERGFAPGLW
jgi:hypothetical protein